MLMAAAKLDNKLLAALNKLYHTRELKQKAKEKLYQALNHTLNAYINTFTQLLYFKLRQYSKGCPKGRDYSNKEKKHSSAFLIYIKGSFL